jgi:ABC-type dipeptide/oligopeptide/nickel transport system ATPase subunit
MTDRLIDVTQKVIVSVVWNSEIPFRAVLKKFHLGLENGEVLRCCTESGNGKFFKVEVAERV